MVLTSIPEPFLRTSLVIFLGANGNPWSKFHWRSIEQPLCLQRRSHSFYETYPLPIFYCYLSHALLRVFPFFVILVILSMKCTLLLSRSLQSTLVWRVLLGYICNSLENEQRALCGPSRFVVGCWSDWCYRWPVLVSSFCRVCPTEVELFDVGWFLRSESRP